MKRSKSEWDRNEEMATITGATFLRMLKALRDNGNVKEKREALLYITSQAKRLEISGAIKEERYRDLCRLVIEAFSKNDGICQKEALGAFNAIMREFRTHSLYVFEAMLQVDMKTRLMIFKLLEVLDDSVVSAAVNDGQALNFFKSNLINVQPTLMEWLTPTACVDNLQMLTKIEQQPLSDEQKLEEEVNSYALSLLRRLYRMAITFDVNVQKFDTLLMDKIITLAYMGHKRQRGPALKLLQQAVASNLSAHIRKEYPDMWAQYKNNLQSVYYKRMLLLVAACDLDWTTQWNTTIQFLGTDLHRGASLINNLLSVEEKAFKSTDPIIRRQAFLSWRLLIDNFALDHQELATARRIKLLCIPLNAKNSKTELIALTKLEIWWHLIIKLYKDIGKFVTPVITQFLNYCFGPLGDTPLLSSKFDVVASPGKRFFKTKVVAVDALSQLLVAKEDLVAVCAPMLEERLPHAISYEVFRDCSKNIIHSIAEALLILGQLTDKEMKNRFQLGKTLWTSLMIYIRTVKLTTKDHLYRDVILVVTELGNHIDKVMVRDMIFNVILPDLNCIIEKTEIHDNALPELVLKLLTSPILDEVLQHILSYDSNTIKCLLERCVGPEFTYSSGVLGFLESIMAHLKAVYNLHKNRDINELAYIEIWSIIAEILTKYIRNTEINGNDNFKVMKSVLKFPFYLCLENFQQITNHSIVWKTLYKEIELHSSLITSMKPNEILLDTASMMRSCLSINKKCCTFIVNCLDILLSTIDYEALFTYYDVPPIARLIMDVITISFNNGQILNSEISLKALTALLSTVYGHSLQRIVSYLQYCKSVVELILMSEITELFKEVAVTWECIISILKGLNKQLDHRLLSSYKTSIIMAMDHPNLDIRYSALSIFEIKDNLDLSMGSKCILDELEKSKEKSCLKSDSVTKKKTETEETKEVHVAGSFLNRKSAITKSGSSKPPEKSDKNTLILPEPDSQDYVYIKTDLKFDVNRLTEHQKETLKRKREDIPALYNDLSQSSSQNSQNLQQWFDIKAKQINEIDKVSNKKSDSTTQKPVDNDANKENKVTTKQVEFSNATDKIIDNICRDNNELNENIEENTVDTKQNEKSMKKFKTNESNEKQDVSKQTSLSPHVASISGNSTSKEDEEADASRTITSIAKKLDFESRDEFPEDKTHERQSSPSMLDNIKRRPRNSMTKSTLSLKDNESVETQKDPNTTNVQRTLRVKTTQGKPGTNNKQKSNDDIDIKENVNENKKGIKRKYMSDTESDGSVQRRKRKLITSIKSEGGGETSRDSVFPDINMDNVSQRVKNEISRLKIDMVFDCPAINRRRVKHSDEGEKETIVHGLRKYGTPDNKSFKLKSLDAKSVEGSKKSLKGQEKHTKDVDDTDQVLFKRRGRRSKQESNKSDLDINKDINKDIKDVNKDVEDINKNVDKNIKDNEDIKDINNKDKDVKKSNDTINKVPELKNANTGMIQVVSTASQTDNQDERLEDNLKSNSDVKPAKLIESSEQSQDEIEDVIESSQVPNVSLTLDKICGEKQCFIKIDKMSNIYSVKTSDAIIGKNYVPESIPMDCGDNDVPDPCEKLDEANPDSNTETKDEENTDSIGKDSVEKTDNSNTKSLISESPKTIDNSSSIKSTSVITFSSPRSNSKIFSKPKPFTGRAAHMLGLVTNQARLESDNPPVLEEESSIKKKTKDTENEIVTNKKISVIKEIDKIAGPSGSRQEKIFSNMRSTDYSVSLSTHSFTTLKNDGEKLSFNLDKGTSECLSTESTTDKENERNTSPLREKDLPILEWSSANPPSLTASPSASILKRHRSSLPESDLDISTPKLQRKRVSFADPPVSKEMGYEKISVAESPQKTIKYSMTHFITPKKDSPITSKQTNLKLISFETDKITEDNTQDENDTEVVMEVEKRNEPPIKISETYTEATDIDVQIPNNDSLESNNIIDMNNSCAKIDNIDELGLAQEIEITTDPIISEDQRLLSSEDSDAASPINVEMEDTETQQDIFDGMNAKTSVTEIQTSNDVNTVVQNDTIDSVKLNVTDDSVIAALPKDDNPTSMEDTMDVQNITELNSTVNADEVFCEKPIRSSTQTTENVAEQDTLSVTDSIFTSLTSTQDIQNQDAPNDAELDPEFLDSTHSIYPTLSSCMEPIDSIIERLTYPLWKQSLNMYFVNRNMRTIGDFAQLSEREVNRMPLKGKPKIEFVKKVLEHFESTCELQTEPSDKKSNEVGQLPTKVTDKEPTVPIAAVTDVETVSATTNNESFSTPLIQPVENTSDNLLKEDSLTIDLDKTKSITSDMDISLEPTVLDNSDLSTLDTSKKDEQISMMIPIADPTSKPGASTDNAEPVPIPSSSSESIATTSQVILSSSDSLDISKDIVGPSSAFDELLITHSSIGTNTDEIGFTTPTVQKLTKSVAAQMTLAELLDEIDLNQVMESAIRRCTPEAILLQYKVKMAHLKEGELLKETIKMLGLQNKQQVNDASLKAACRACGVNKVLLRLPDIFSYDKQFFDKVLKVYSKKLNIADGLNNLEFNQLKGAICKKCTLSEIVQILSEKLKQEEQEGIKQSMSELSSLSALLRRLPMDVIISHTVANEELIPARVVLDIALQNNSSGDIAEALKQSPVMAKRVLDKLWTSQFTVTHIENNSVSKESLLNIFKSVSSRLTTQELLDAYHEAMTSKLTNEKNTKDLTDEKE